MQEETHVPFNVALTVLCIMAGILFYMRQRRRESLEATARTQAATSAAASAATEKQHRPPSQKELAQLLGNLPAGDADGESDGDDDPEEVQDAPLCKKQEQASASADHGLRILEAIQNQQSKDGDIAALLRSADAEAVNAVDDTGQNALQLIAMEGHVEACQVLLSRQDFNGVNVRNLTGASALHLAAGNDHVDICRELIECPRFTFGVDAPDDRGQTPLDFCTFGEGLAVELLRKAGATKQQDGDAGRRRGIRMHGPIGGADGVPEDPADAEDDGSGKDMDELD